MPSESVNNGGSSGPRYAPEDPTLPLPWKGLVDGSTGYIYYWNTETNATQYEKPVKDKAASKKAVSSSVHREDVRKAEKRVDSKSRNNQYQDDQPYDRLCVELRGSGHNAHNSREPAKGDGHSDANGSLLAEAYRRKNEITAIGDDVPAPYMTFESTGFPAEILKEVHKAGFTAPTPIQAQSWPIALRKRDVVAIAKTGSGKTLGYLIPGFLHIKRTCNNPRMGPTVLVLAPTRELATQIQEETVKFGISSRISCTCIYGGAPKGPQLRDLSRGVDVVVATPGRLNDILEMRRISLGQVSYLVLDEADRMLDMGFEPQIRKIVEEIPKHRQTLMYTATWPKEVRKIAADLLVHPIQVNIGNIDELVANKSITQHVEIMKPIEKQRRLENILRSQEPGSKVIIFCSTKKLCDQLARNLARQFGAAAIHGDKNQNERDRVLDNFRTGRCPILVATDVAARGLDIKDIRVVVNFDFPTGVEDYVHRIGRTGRAGATGVSYTFFTDQDSKYSFELVKVLEGAGQHVPPQLHDMVARGGYGGKSKRWGPLHDRGCPNGMMGPGYGAAAGDRGRPFPSRYNHDRDYQVRQSSNTTDHRNTQGKIGMQTYSRSRSRSRSPRAEARGRPDTKVMPSRGRVTGRSYSRSLSPSSTRGHSVRGPREHRSPSPSFNRKGRFPLPKKREQSYDERNDRHGSPTRLNREYRSSYTEVGRREATLNLPNHRNGAKISPASISHPLFYNGEEIEEGMILPDEE